MKFNLTFEELDKNRHERKTFDCCQQALNDFIQHAATRNREAGISKTMVLPQPGSNADKHTICCFYTLSHTQIQRENLPQSIAKKLPRYPIPVLLIAQLAVHLQFQQQGFGKVTLIHALKHCVEINAHLPSNAIVVDAIDEKVCSFYEQYGFKVLVSNSQRPRLYLPMQTAIKLFSE